MSVDGTGPAVHRPPSTGFELTDDERAQLQGLVEELVEATEDRVFWLGRVRETALEIQRRLATMLERDD